MTQFRALSLTLKVEVQKIVANLRNYVFTGNTRMSLRNKVNPENRNRKSKIRLETSLRMSPTIFFFSRGYPDSMNLVHQILFEIFVQHKFL